MIPLGAGINGSLAIAKALGVDETRGIWIAASYPYVLVNPDVRYRVRLSGHSAEGSIVFRLTQGAFVVIGGRIGAVYGHKNTLLAAGVWWVTFSLISGFMKNFIALCVMRGFTGIGGAFMMPNALAILTINFPPGKMRNITVGFFGAMAPIGAAGGGVVAGIFVQLTPWKWLFFFLSVSLPSFHNGYSADILVEQS
jgi:MFS family permease